MPAAYSRPFTPFERMLRRSPYSIVTLVARIRGPVTESMLHNAVAKVRQRHTNLRVRTVEDADHNPRFTSDGVGEIEIQVVPRESDDHWIRVQQESSRVPFDFETRPAVRLILVQSPGLSELIILCHHILCDGLSLAYLARDLLIHLGDPAREAEVLPDPVLLQKDTMPPGPSLNPILKLLINRINKQWEKDRVVFDEEDYRAINEAYWANYEHSLLSIELSEAQTTALVERCRKEGATVNAALTAAFVGAQLRVLGARPYHSAIGIAASLRDRLRPPVGEVMGFYASLVNLKYDYDARLGFWENARRLHQKAQTLFTDKALFGEFAMLNYVQPALFEAIHFKKLGGLVAPSSPRYDKLHAFGTRDDVVYSLLKRDRRESLDRIFMGTAVTNLTRLEFPTQYGELELDRLIMQPGAGFPLVNVNLVLGAVTCAGKLSLVVEHAPQVVDSATVRRITDTAMETLLEE